jgi:outer membrane protein assembly factor BamB
MRIIILFLIVTVIVSQIIGADNWPEFRGPTKDGHAQANNLPVTWSESKNIKWKIPIHDRGWSSPVIWGDQIWVTTALEDGKQMFAVCVSLKTGEVMHDVKIFDNEDLPRIASMNSYASPSPVIEEGRVYVHFGSFGTACLNTNDGKVLWQRRDIICDHEEGPGSSPVLFKNLLILTMDGGDVQFLEALDKNSGETVWKTKRSTVWPEENDYRLAFGTPLIVDFAGTSQLVTTGSKSAWSYDPSTGEEIWQVRYSGWSNSSRTISHKDKVFINTGFDDPQLMALKLGGRGDITESHVIWKTEKDVPKIPSPIIVDGLIYMVSDKGSISCLESESGKMVWRERLGRTYVASPIHANGMVYFFDHKGKTTVIKAGESFEPVSENHLDDGFMASPAVAGNSLILRTKSHLYRIEK